MKIYFHKLLRAQYIIIPRNIIFIGEKVRLCCLLQPPLSELLPCRGIYESWSQHRNARSKPSFYRFTVCWDVPSVISSCRTLDYPSARLIRPYLINVFNQFCIKIDFKFSVFTVPIVPRNLKYMYRNRLSADNLFGYHVKLK